MLPVIERTSRIAAAVQTYDKLWRRGVVTLTAAAAASQYSVISVYGLIAAQL